MSAALFRAQLRTQVGRSIGQVTHHVAPVFNNTARVSNVVKKSVKRATFKELIMPDVQSHLRQGPLIAGLLKQKHADNVNGTVT
jgi:hypothetical protein